MHRAVLYCPAALLKCIFHNHVQILDVSLCRACLCAAGASLVCGTCSAGWESSSVPPQQCEEGCLWSASLEFIRIKYLENYLASLWSISVVRNTGQMGKERIDVCVYSSWNILVPPVWHFFGVSFESHLSSFITLEFNVLLPLTQVTLFWYGSVWD